jgi:hypothetical protein
MNILKKLLKNISNQIILLLILIIIFLKTCSKQDKPQTKTITTTTIETKWDTVKTSIPIYIPKYHTKIVNKYDTLWKDVDTSYILKDYFSLYVYFDTINKDSLTLVINDTITQNKIKNRKIDYKILYPTKTITIHTKEYINNRELYLGLGLGATINEISYINGGLLFKTKKKNIYNIGVGLNNNFQPIINGGIYRKL